MRHSTRCSYSSEHDRAGAPVGPMAAAFCRRRRAFTESLPEMRVYAVHTGLEVSTGSSGGGCVGRPDVQARMRPTLAAWAALSSRPSIPLKVVGVVAWSLSRVNSGLAG